jgi:hypothetical protein
MNTQPTTAPPDHPNIAPPPPEPSDAQRIAARGRPITLADGRTARLRFSLRSLARLEEDFGSLGAVAEVLNAGVGAAGEAAVVGPLLRLMHAGLIHERLSLDELDDLLEPSRLRDYSEATAAAFREAMPGGKDPEVPTSQTPTPAPPPVVQLPAPETPTAASTGPASTTWGPSPSGAATAPGGA